MKRVRENSKDEENNGTTKKVKKFVKEFSDALLKACTLGKTDLARTLCANGADPNACTEGKREPLDEEYLKELRRKRQYDIIRMISAIHYGAEKESGLHLASENGHVDIVKMLIRNGADVNVATQKKWTAIHFAASKGHAGVVKVLIQNGADVNALFQTKYTGKLNALIFAASLGHIDVVSLLLLNGADVNSVDRYQNTALHCAIKREHFDVAKLLIDNGADVNAMNECRYTPLSTLSGTPLITLSGTPLITLSETVGDAVSSYLSHRVGSSVNLMKLLISKGADVNAVVGDEFDKHTPLQKAALNNNVDFVKVLIQNGADVNAVTVNSYYSSALIVATSMGHIDCVNVLLQNGADVNITGPGVFGPALHCCATHVSTDIIKVLIQNDADLNASNWMGWTPLGEAASRGRAPCMLQLICSGAEITEYAHNPDAFYYHGAFYHHDDRTGLLEPIKSRFISLREGNGMETSLMSDDERRFMWNLAMVLHKCHGGNGLAVYEMVRSFITFHGIFMGPGYDIGDESIWRCNRKNPWTEKEKEENDS